MKWIVAIVVLALGADASAQGCSSPGGGYGGYYYQTSLFGTGLFPSTRFQPTYVAPSRYFAPVRYVAPVQYAATVRYYATTVRYAPTIRTTYTTTANCSTSPPGTDYGGYYAPMAPAAAPRGRYDTRACPGGF